MSSAELSVRNTRPLVILQDSRQKELCRAELTYVLVLALGPEGWRTAAYSEGYESLVAAQDASSNLTSLSEVR